MRNVNGKTKLISQRLSQLSAARQALGISQRRQAIEIGWTPGTLNQYLLGNSPINYDALFTMCDYFSVSPFKIDPDLWGRVMRHPPKQGLAE